MRCPNCSGELNMSEEICHNCGVVLPPPSKYYSKQRNSNPLFDSDSYINYKKSDETLYRDIFSAGKAFPVNDKAEKDSLRTLIEIAIVLLSLHIVLDLLILVINII